jgi:hypothetical protein
VAERPILFSSPMVRAILDGRKTVTRRIVKERSPHWVVDERGDGTPWLMVARDSVRGASIYDDAWLPAACPYGAPGDHLWVRETWGVAHEHADTITHSAALEDARRQMPWAAIVYADETHTKPKKWRPSIHMPRWASRILLDVTAVRVERLQAISEEDARAEGVKASDAAAVFQRVGTSTHGLPHVRQVKDLENTARGAFACLWDSINGERAPWASDPHVWVVSFKLVEMPNG